MVRSILVPVDGSPSAEQALTLAARLAARDGARLDLVLVTERVSPLEMALGAPVPEPRLDYALRQERVVYLTDLAKRIERDQSVRATANVSEGPVADTLARLVAEGDTDLVMMTTHGRGGMSPTWLASTADALVSRVDIPVLVVRPSEGHEPQAVAAAFPPRRVLIPLDGSELAESVLDAAVAVGGSSATYILARASDAEAVHGLTVEIVGLERDAAADLRTRVHDYLNAVAAGLRARGLQVETKALHGRDLAEAILDTANASRADLIAIAMPAGDIMERLVVGIVAEQIARGTAVPVLLRRPVQAPKAATP